MVYAKSPAALKNLQRQFEEHTVRKTYMARISTPDDFRESIGPETVLPPWLQGEGPETKSWEGLFPEHCFSGAITLPLSPDYDERPRQKVDFKQGKAAHTDYEVVQANPDGTADLLLYPHTGRTHQLRVHCAHTLGLGCPILGDLLYGGWSAHQVRILKRGTPECGATSTTASRLHLHALSLTFRHPTTGEELTFTSRELCYNS
jgi:tRNA pseudouridine32 synthase/23S rRNA pseudouridine746 synthase